MRRSLLVLLLLPFALSACEWVMPPPPEPTPESPPGEPFTKEQVLAEMEPMVEPFRQIVRAGTGAAVALSLQDRNQVIEQLRDAHQRYAQYENGRSAMRTLGKEIIDIAKEASEQERWRLVQACVDAHEILNMDSLMLDRLDERAQVLLARPKVTVRGFMEDGETKDVFVFLEIAERQTGRTKTVTLREGEIVDTLRVVEIIGANQAVRLEYLPVEGLEFVVDGLSW